MPTNITPPNQALFTIKFSSGGLDNSDVSFTPSSAQVTIVYPINGISNSTTLTLTLSGGFWTATWNPSSADVPSNATWTVVSSCSPNAAATGTIRLIDP